MDILLQTAFTTFPWLGLPLSETIKYGSCTSLHLSPGFLPKEEEAESELEGGYTMGEALNIIT